MYKLLLMSGVLSVAVTALAADSGVTRKVFDRMDVPSGYETVVGAAGLSEGSALGRHSHHGTEFGYVAEGEIELAIDGMSPQRLKAGEFFKIDAGKIHDARSVGGAAKAVVTWVVEKGKPLAEPAK